MTLITRIVHRLRQLLRWLRSIAVRVFGPPVSAARRVVKRIIDFIWKVVEAILAAWARLWRRNPEDRARRRPVHLPACTALATLLTAVAVLATPLPSATGWSTGRRLDLLTGVVWAAAVIVLAIWSSSDTETWFRRDLQAMRHRTGLIRIERVSALVAVLSLAALPDSFRGTLVLRALVLLSFVAFLVDEYHERRASFEPRASGPRTDAVEGEPPSGFVRKRFSWTLRAGELDVDLTTSIDLADDAVTAARQSNPKHSDPAFPHDFKPWVTGPGSSAIERLAATFIDWSRARGWSPYIEAALVLSFVQSFSYRSDEESVGEEEYWRYPIETLHDVCGDCEDTTILAAAILRSMGHTVGVFMTDDHAALAISAPPGVIGGEYFEIAERRFYYCETTSSGWRIGERPPTVDPDELRVALVDPEQVQAA